MTPPIRTDGERLSARRARAKRRYLDLEQAECQSLHVFSQRSISPLPRFPRGGIDKRVRARLNRVRGLIDALLQVVQLDACALGQLAVAAPDRFS
jgi:hypothetical protein